MRGGFRVVRDRHTLVELLEFVGFPFCQLHDFCQHAKFAYVKEPSDLYDIFREICQLRDMDTKALVADSRFNLV